MGLHTAIPTSCADESHDAHQHWGGQSGPASTSEWRNSLALSQLFVALGSSVLHRLFGHLLPIEHLLQVLVEGVIGRSAVTDHRQRLEDVTLGSVDGPESCSVGVLFVLANGRKVGLLVAA